MPTTFRIWLGIRATIGGWMIGIIGAAANHFTPSELTLTLALIGCIVPLGVAWITTHNKPREINRAELQRLRNENTLLRQKVKELSK